MEDIVTFTETEGFIKKAMINSKTKSMLKKCRESHAIIKKLYPHYRDNHYAHVIYLGSNDKIIPITCYRGYSDNGVLSPITIIDPVVSEQIKGEVTLMKNEICEIDLYERSVFVYNLREKGEKIIGNLINFQKDGKAQDVIFTKTLISVLKKNINNIKRYDTFEHFADTNLI